MLSIAETKNGIFETQRKIAVSTEYSCKLVCAACFSVNNRGEAMAEEFEQVTHCQMCGAEYLVGRQGNDGRHIPTYDLHVCDTCYSCNDKGWAPLYEQKLVEHIEQRDIPLPARNKNGLLPRD